MGGIVQTTIIADYGRSRRMGSLAPLPGSGEPNWRNGANWLGDVTLGSPAAREDLQSGRTFTDRRCPVPTARSGEHISPLLRWFTRIHAATLSSEKPVDKCGENQTIRHIVGYNAKAVSAPGQDQQPRLIGQLPGGSDGVLICGCS
jgi:hypothetical protein